MPVKLIDTPALTFDDVLIVPKRSSVYSRKQVSLRTRLVGDLEIGLPFISANMDTVTELRMAEAMHDLGALGIIHRFLPEDEHVALMNRIPGLRILAIGVKPADLRKISRIDRLSGVLIDVAHGHSDRVIEIIGRVREEHPDLWIIAGNVATAEGAWDLLDAGAHAIKVGVGPGAVCTTRIVTGCGVPQLTAIMKARAAIDRWWDVERRKDKPRTSLSPTLIADGGIRNSGDVVKALVAGANSVMIGSLFAGTDESPGEVVTRDGRAVKLYRGMASAGAMEVIGVERTPEGVETYVPWQGPVATLLRDLEGGVRSGLSYTNSESVADLHQQTIEFIKVSGSAKQESLPHAAFRSFERWDGSADSRGDEVEETLALG
ncbi:MAG: guanosine monophosphate reductase [Candidatus Sericytochromatia bacterium]|nr:guanosine monophosphate reductase [Candidatus Tanganyikabacteria bacterium]